MSEPFDPKELPEWKEAAALGVDLHLLEANLRMTPWERVLANSRAAEFAMMLRDAGKQKYGV